MSAIIPLPFMKWLFDQLAVEDLRVLLTGPGLAMDNEDEFIGDIATLDEKSGTGYVRKALSGETTSQDNANDRAEFTASSPITWSSPNPNVGLVAAAIFYIEGASDAARRIVAKVDTFVVTVTGGSYDDIGHGDGDYRLEATGAFASYTHVAGTKILIQAGSGVTPGLYTIGSKVSNNVILLTASAGSDSTSDVSGGVPVDLDGTGPFEVQLDAEGLIQAYQI